MVRQDKKEQLKLIIQEFHELSLPEVFDRELTVPLNSRKIVTIHGPRRSGKSFYFYLLTKKLLGTGVLKERIVYINFEDDRILPLSAQDLNLVPEAYFELYPEYKDKKIYFFFDEIQNVPNWEVFVRRLYDKESVQLFVTGSSSKLLPKDIATSLRGRTLSFALYPLNFREFLLFKGITLHKNVAYSKKRFDIKKFVREFSAYGGFPEIVLEKNAVLKGKILREYFESLVYRDLAERHSLENTLALRDLLRFLSTNASSLFSANAYHKAVKQNVPVSRETIADYLAFIQDTGYFTLLPKFSYSLKEQVVNQKKVVALDNGLKNIATFRFSKDEGKNAENLVGSLLARKEESLYYWNGKQEVDFVWQQGRKLNAVNVTYGNTIEEREHTSLLEFKNAFRGVERLTLVTKDTEEKRGAIQLIPLWKWLLEI